MIGISIVRKPAIRLISFGMSVLLLFSIALSARLVHSSAIQTFGTTGYKTFDFNGDDSVVDALVTDAGKIVLLVNSYHLTSVVMLNEDGSLNTGFGTGGVTSMISTLTSLNKSKIDVTSDGKFIISNSTCWGCFTRLLSSGLVDTSFGTAGTLNFIIVSGQTSNNGYFWLGPIWSKADNRFLILQNYVSQSGQYYMMKKFKSDLSIDTSFGVDGVLDIGLNPTNGSPQDWFVKDDGQIIVANIRANGQGRTVTVIEQRRINGQLDTGFGNNGVSEHIFMNGNTSVSQLTFGQDGSIWVVAYNDYRSNFILIKVASNGLADSHFGVNGMIDTGIQKEMSAIVPLANGGVIYASSNNSRGVRTYRFSSRGELDESYKSEMPEQILPLMGVKKVIIDANGQAIVFGGMVQDAAVVRYGETGVVDNPSAWLPTTSTTVRPVATTTVAPVVTTTVAPVVTTTVAPVVTTTVAPVVTTTVAPVNAPALTSSKLTASKTASAKSIATFAKLTVLSNSKVSLKVVSAYAKYCKVSGTALKGLKTGSCKVTVTVTPKKGKATSKTVTLKITK